MTRRVSEGLVAHLDLDSLDDGLSLARSLKVAFSSPAVLRGPLSSHPGALSPSSQGTLAPLTHPNAGTGLTWSAYSASSGCCAVTDWRCYRPFSQVRKSGEPARATISCSVVRCKKCCMTVAYLR